MTEADLAPNCVEWLRRRGLDPRSEVMLPCGTNGRMRPVDVCGYDSRRLVCIEMKRTLNRSAVEQAASCRTGATEAWCAVQQVTPLGMSLAIESGCGVLMPDSGTMFIVQETVVSASDPAAFMDWLEILSRAPEGREAGHPTRAGVSAAADERDALIAYFLANPDSSWRLAYRNVSSSADKWTALRTSHSRAVCAALGLTKIR